MPLSVRALALTAALLGGMCWVLNLFVDAHGLSWAGSILLASAIGLGGTRLARLAWVAAIASVGALGLGWALLELLRDLAEVRVVEGVIGAGAALLVGLAMLRPDDAPAAPRHAGEPVARRGNHRG